MSQRVIGIDLGAHTVKVAVLDVGFRSFELKRLQTIAIEPGSGTELERGLRALTAAAVEAAPEDVVCVGIPGDQALLRVYELPFGDLRRLRPVVANELADDLPWEPEDVVFDHTVPKNGERVLAAAARREDVGAVLEQLAEAGLEPRQLLLASTSYAAIIRRLYLDEAVLVIDVGHLRTNVALVQGGRTLFARTISRGGAQVTDALRAALQLSYQEAETFKRQQGSVADDPSVLTGGAQRLATTTLHAVTPLIRELRRTLALARSTVPVVAQRAVLCGGGARLKGLAEYLAVELDLPTEELSFVEDPELQAAELPSEGQMVGALALGLALEHGRKQSLDLRRGEFGFKSERSLLRDKAAVLGAWAIALVVLAVLSMVASYRVLETEREQLRRELARVTAGVFGRAEPDAEAASRRVRLGSRHSGSDIPTATAVDVFKLVSDHVPGRGQIKLDLSRLDVKAGQAYLQGTADSRGAVGEILEALKQVDCFSKVSAGRISEVADGKKQFSLTIKTKCF